MRTNPEAVIPKRSATKRIGLIKAGPQDISVTRTSLDWGVKVPWDEKHVFYVWYDALINYATAVGYGQDEARFEKWWPVVRHLIGKDILRFHCVYWPALCMAAGIDPPRVPSTGTCWWAGKKCQRRRSTKFRRPTWCQTFGVDGFRYHFLRDQPFGPTASSPTRAWSLATTPTSPTTSATCWRG